MWLEVVIEPDIVLKIWNFSAQKKIEARVESSVLELVYLGKGESKGKGVFFEKNLIAGLSPTIMWFLPQVIGGNKINLKKLILLGNMI